MKKLLTILIGTLLMIFGCKPENPLLQYAGLCLDKTQIHLSLDEQESVLLSAFTVPYPIDTYLEWDIGGTGLNSNIISLNIIDDSTVEIFPIGVGETDINVFDSENGKGTSCRVTVYSDPTKIRLNIDRLYLPVGKAQVLTVYDIEKSPSEPLTNVSWRISSEAVATVDPDGKVTAVSEGEARIEASFVKKSGEILKAVCFLTVKPSEDEEISACAVMFSEELVEAAVGDRLTPAVTVYPPEAAERLILTAEEGLTVNEDGSVTVDRLGASRLTATVDGIKDTLSVAAVSFEGSESEIITILPSGSEEDRSFTYRLTLTDTEFSDAFKNAIVRPESFSFELKAPNIKTVKSNIFDMFPGLKSVVMENATIIEDFGFFGCAGLTSVELPAAVSIGNEAFAGCRLLTSVGLPSVTSIGNEVFSGCTGLTSVSLPSVTSIGNEVFPGCTGLTSVSLPSVTSIGNEVFSGCTGLTSVSLPSVKSIGNASFSGCTGLTSVSFPAVTSIGDKVFSGCKALTSVSFPSLTAIGSGAFSDCFLLTTVSLPDLQTAGNGIFANCLSLSETELGLPLTESVPLLFARDYPLKLHLKLPKVIKVGDFAFNSANYNYYDFFESIDLPAAVEIGVSAFSPGIREIRMTGLKNTRNVDADIFNTDFSDAAVYLPSLTEFSNLFFKGVKSVYMTSPEPIECLVTDELNCDCILYLHQNKKDEVKERVWKGILWSAIYFVNDADFAE